MALSPSRLALGAAGLVAVLLGCAALASQSKTSGPVEDYADPLAAAVSDVEQYGKQVSEYTAEMKRAGCNDITMLMNQNDHLHSAYARRMQRYQEQLPRREWHAVLALEERRVQPELHREYHAYTARLSLCASTSLGRARALVQKQESDLDAIMPVIDAAQCHDDSIKHVADRLHKLKFNFDQNLAAMRRELGYKHWHGIKVLEQATASQAFDSAQEALAEKQNWCAVHKFHTAMTEHYHRLHDLRAHIRHHVATHCAHNAAHIVMSGVHAAVDALEKDIATKPSLTEPAASELATRYVSHHLDHARSLAKHLLVHCRLSLARDAMTHSSTDDLSTHLNHLDAAMRHMMHGADDERKQLEDYARGSSSGSEGSEAADDFDKIFHSLNNGHHYEAHHAALYKAAAALAHHHGEHWRAALPLVQKRSRMARHAWFQVVAAPACRHLKGILQEYEHTVSPTLEDLDRHMAAAHPNDRAILDAYISLDALPAEARLSSTVASRWKACTIHLQAS